MTRDEIQTKVTKVLVDALGVDEDEVTPTAVVRHMLEPSRAQARPGFLRRGGGVTPA